MRVRNEEQYMNRKQQLMEKSFECLAENGLSGVGIRALAKHCECNAAVFYNYFADMDDLIVQSAEYCMSKVEDDFMQLAPTGLEDIARFIDEVPYWTAKRHGKKYRLMYQVYTHPKYIEHGKAFFAGVNERYHAYAKQLEPLLGLPCDVIEPLMFIFVRASVHYALFEDEYYLKSQLNVLKQSVFLLSGQHRKENLE